MFSTVFVDGWFTENLISTVLLGEKLISTVLVDGRFSETLISNIFVVDVFTET